MKRTYGGQNKKAYKKYKYNQGTDLALATTHYVVNQSRADYALTLVDPWAKLDCRIPDLACYPTATFTIDHVFEWNPDVTTVAAANSQLLRVGMHGSSFGCFYPAFNVTGGVSGDVKGFSALPSMPSGITGGIATLYKSARVVSAGIKVTWAGNDSNTTGTIYCTYVPGDATSVVAARPVLYDTAAAWTSVNEHYMGPMRLGCIARFKPHDTGAFDMKTTAAITAADASTYPQFGDFYVAVNPGTGVTGLKFNVQLSINYEGLVTGNNVGIDTGVSAADPVALAHGMNVAGRCLTSFAATAASENDNIRTPSRLVVAKDSKSK